MELRGGFAFDVDAFRIFITKLAASGLASAPLRASLETLAELTRTVVVPLSAARLDQNIKLSVRIAWAQLIANLKSLLQVLAVVSLSARTLCTRDSYFFLLCAVH